MRFYFCVLAMLAVATASAEEEAKLDGEQLYTQRTCFACHGPKGDKPLLPSYPKIAGQSAAYAEQQMHDIKSGARSNGQSAAMQGVMHLVDDDEIKVLAEYLSTL